jgi:hypothetical protein
MVQVVHSPVATRYGVLIDPPETGDEGGMQKFSMASAPANLI